MQRANPRRLVLHAGLALGASLVLPAARGCEFFTPTLRIKHPWTRATPVDARFAVVCMTFDEVTAADRLIGVETPVAEHVELMGQGVGPAVDLLIPEGRETALEEAGTHLRLVGLNNALLFARTYPLKLVFEKGGESHTKLTVDFLRVS